jgi:antitoxin VapB
LTYPDVSLQLEIRSTYPEEPIVEQGAVFKSNRSQAVRLPKSVALPDDVTRVDVVAIGRTRILTPAGESWDSWFDSEGVSADFMSARDQPGDQEREGF